MPGDTKTHLARLAKRSRRSSGSLNGARLRLWSALEAAEACLLDAVVEGDRDGVLKAAHCVTQTAGAFARVFEVGELEARFTALLDEVETLKKQHGRSDSPNGPAGTVNGPLALPIHPS